MHHTVVKFIIMNPLINPSDLNGNVYTCIRTEIYKYIHLNTLFWIPDSMPRVLGSIKEVCHKIHMDDVDIYPLISKCGCIGFNFYFWIPILMSIIHSLYLAMPTFIFHPITLMTIILSQLLHKVLQWTICWNKTAVSSCYTSPSILPTLEIRFCSSALSLHFVLFYSLNYNINYIWVGRISI